jgi:hypothetical protein
MGNDSRNFANDFFDAISSQEPSAQQRGLPPLHPSGNDKYVNLGRDERTASDSGVQNLFEFTKNKGMKVHIQQFRLDKAEDIEAYEKIENDCLEKGWILAREEWNFDVKSGTQVVTVKYIETTPKQKAKKENKEDTDHANSQ